MSPPVTINVASPLLRCCRMSFTSLRGSLRPHSNRVGCGCRASELWRCWTSAALRGCAGLVVAAADWPSWRPAPSDECR
jgi:hypothetical protein